MDYKKWLNNPVIAAITITIILTIQQLGMFPSAVQNQKEHAELYEKINNTFASKADVQEIRSDIRELRELIIRRTK